MIPLVVQSGDRALEVGCHGGVTTALLHDTAGPAGRVVGVDIGPSIIGKARCDFPHVQFDVADGWNTAALAALAVGADGQGEAGSWDAIFVDVGGLSGPDGFLEATALVLLRARGGPSRSAGYASRVRQTK